MLNDFSERFAAVLFAQYPDWDKYAGQVTEFDGRSSLVVQVPCPNPRVIAGLSITTDGDEVTVGLDRYHTHFMQDEEQVFESALEFIAGLMSEELVVLVYMNDEQWAGSRCVGPDDPWPPPKPGQCRYLRSWLGIHTDLRVQSP